jgi:hypothetical protein
MPKAKTKGSDADALLKIRDDMRDKFIANAAELWDKHWGEAVAIVKEAEEKKVTLNYKAMIDFTESKPMLTTRIAFSQAFTDETTTEFEDPDQMPLPGMFIQKPKPGGEVGA